MDVCVRKLQILQSVLDCILYTARLGPMGFYKVWIIYLDTYF